VVAFISPVPFGRVVQVQRLSNDNVILTIYDIIILVKNQDLGARKFFTKMIYFLYGEDNFRSHKKLTEIKSKFADNSLGTTNISIFEAETTDFEKIDQAIQAMPFLSSKKLVIIKNAISSKNSELQSKLSQYLDKVPRTTILIFFEKGIIDKRSGLFKKLIKIAKSKEFIKLEIPQVKNWIRKTVEGQGGKIDQEAVDKLIVACGQDLWRLDNEIEKLISYDKNIKPKNIDKLVHAQINPNIFDLVDAVGSKNLKKCTKTLKDLIDAGTNEIYIHSMIVYQLRNLITVKSLQNKGLSQLEIIKKTRLHPFVVRKTIIQVANFDLAALKKIYRRLLDADFSIKTGKTEPRLSLDLLLIGLCQRI